MLDGSAAEADHGAAIAAREDESTLDEVAALVHQRDAARAALKPFSDCAEVYGPDEIGEAIAYCRVGFSDNGQPDLVLTVKNLFDARAALDAPAEKEQTK